MGKSKVMLLLMMLFFGFSSAMAQRTLSGKVVGDDGKPVLGATVSIKGTTVGTISGEDGTYNLKVPANIQGDTLVFSFIGMLTVEENINGRSTINAMMISDDVAVDEVVVTALGISRSEKTIGYAATKVSSDEIVGARTTNVADALSGKVAGVQVSATSANPGAVSNVIIRGVSSINGSNTPLYVVDGIPMTNSSASGNGTTFATSGISNISSSDIESLTVLKGAAATALYGSRAANGVILITTKSGKKHDGKNYSIEYNGTVQARRVSYLPNMQNTFGQGWNGRQTFIENGSWGPAFDGTNQLYGPIYNGQALYHKYEALDNNVMDFFETGISQNHNISFNGVSDDNKLKYYVSYGYNGDNGIMPNDHDTYDRNSIAFNTSYEASNWLTIRSAVNFSRIKTEGVDADQGVTPIDGLLELPRDVSIVDMEDLSNVFNTPQAYFTPYGITNPYWALENNKLAINAKEVLGKIEAQAKIIDNLKFTYRMSYNYNDRDFKFGSPKISNSEDLVWDNKGYATTNMNQAGFVTSYMVRAYEVNHDFHFTYNTAFVDDKLTLDVLAGGNVNERYSSNVSSTASNLAIPTGFWVLSNGAEKTTLSDGISKRRLVSALGTINIGWDDFVFVDFTVRNDWSSTLPLTDNSYFYPGAALSYIFTKHIPENNILSFGKIRVAYGSTGKDADVYATTDTYVPGYANAYYATGVYTFPNNGVNAYQKATTAGNTALKNELTKEIEFGTNLQFFNGKIGLDASFYKKNTKDQVFTLPVDPSTGYSSMIVNYGEVENKGLELLLTTTPVQVAGFRWDLDINFSKIWNKIVSLPKELEGGKTVLNSFGAGNDAVYMYAVEGKPAGEFYSYRPTYDEAGHIIVGNDGMPIVTPEIEDTGKSINADWTGGITTSLSYKGIALSASLDVRKGGYMLSRTKNIMYFTGNGENTTYNDRKPFVIPNSVVNIGNDANGKPLFVENTTPLYMTNSGIQNFYDAGGIEGGEQYLIDRSFAKLRNISLSYTLPMSIVRSIRLSEVTFGVFCNNVFTWTACGNKYIDPENTSYGNRGDLAAQFGELYCNPSCRIWGFNLGLKF